MTNIFLPPRDAGMGNYIRGICARVGVAYGPVRADLVIAHSDEGAQQAPWAIGNGTTLTLQSRIAKSGIQGCMPTATTTGDSAEVLGAGAVFAKPDMQKAVLPNGKMYMPFVSASEALAFFATVRPEIAAKFCLQPSVGDIADLLTLEVAVNAAGQVHIAAPLMVHQTNAANQPAFLESTTLPAGIADTVQRVVDAYQIRGCIHDAQFLQLNGEWKLTDWNPRLMTNHSSGVMPFDVHIENAVRHLVGADQITVDTSYVQSRIYREHPVTTAQLELAKSVGLTPIFGHQRYTNRGIDRLVFRGADKATADAAFATFEETL